MADWFKILSVFLACAIAFGKMGMPAALVLFKLNFFKTFIVTVAGGITGNILFTNFNELFIQDFGYADYVKLCQRFGIIVLEGVRRISEDETNIIIRVINFIDNAYFYKVLLFALLEAEPSLIYTSGKRLAEFQRAVSRLNEMNSSDEKLEQP